MISLIRQVPLFAKLTEEQTQRIMNISSRKTVKAGTVLFREKERGDVFYIVASGSVKVYTSNPGGEEKVLSVFGPGESFGELSLIDGQPRSASAQTVEDSVLLSIRGDDFLDLLRTSPDISLGIMKELCRRLRDTNDHVYDLTFVDARTRVLKHVILFANKNGVRNGNVIHIKIPLNYDELSRMAGVTKSVLMEVIRDLERVRLLTPTMEGFILDLGKLQAGR